jgi:protein SCO1/2
MDCLSSTVASSAAFLVLCALLTGCGASTSPLPSLGLVPDFTLTDENNHDFKSGDALKDKVWIGDFVYTQCPGPCPMMSSLMRKVQDQLGDETHIRLVSFTVDPARDTPEVLAAYAKQFGARPKFWFFLTGSQDALNQLSRHAFKLGDVDGNLEHSTRFVLVDKFGRLRGYYSTDSAAIVPQLVADAKSLEKEKF